LGSRPLPDELEEFVFADWAALDEGLIEELRGETGREHRGTVFLAVRTATCFPITGEASTDAEGAASKRWIVRSRSEWGGTARATICSVSGQG
jgi:hypothetical protein